MDFEFDDFVTRAGLGLEAEDHLLLGSGLVQGQHGGLSRLFNERYYQFIVWRAVSPRWNAKVEHKTHDLVIFDERGQYAVVIEMKAYGSKNGIEELPGIHSDLDKLSQCGGPIRAMMVFSTNPRGQSAENIKFLEEKIPRLISEGRKSYVFNTFNEKGEKYEFWLAVWLL
ncbi:MAG: hypothetical protein ACLP8A_18215 [Methylovirgula sp.]